MAPVASLNELANSGIQGPSEDALLQPDMLKSLLSSVNNLNESVLKLQEENKALHESVSKLKDENKEVKNKLSTLQEHCGVVFTYFPELPPELRRRIWKLAARAPQVHIINHEGASRSKVNSIYNSCLEARKAVQELKLDFFVCRFSLFRMKNTQRLYGRHRNYINLDVDTIWFNGPSKLHLVPLEIQWICGKCKVGYNNEDPCYAGCEEKCLSRGGFTPKNLFRLAINYPSWVNPGNNLNSLGSLSVPLHNGVKELLVIVGNFEQYERQRDVTFVAPSVGPYYVKNAMTESEKQRDNARSKTWTDICSDFRGVMQKFKEDRVKDIVRYENHYWGPNQLHGATQLKLLRDIENWTVPEVKFFEVRAEPRNWVRFPQYNPWEI